MDGSPLKYARFRLLWTGGVVSGLGSWLLIVALPVQVFKLTGSPTATGLTLALEALPGLLLGPWAGVLLDRWNPARAMVLADLAAAVSVAAILLVDRPGRLWLLYLAVLGENSATTVFRPAARIIMPNIVGTGTALASANALSALSGSVLRLSAPVLGALLLSGPGITSVLIIDVGSYLISAALLGRLGRLRIKPASPGETDGLRAGLAYIARSPSLRGPLIGNGAFLTANAALTALLVPFVVGPLDASGAGVGYIISGLGLGYVLGSTLSRFLLTRLDTRPLLVATQLATGVTYFTLFNAPGLPTAIVAAVLIGVPGSILLICVETHVQRTVPPDLLGRVGALFFAMDSLAAIAGALTGAGLAAALGLSPALNVISAAALLAAPLTWNLMQCVDEVDEKEGTTSALTADAVPSGPEKRLLADGELSGQRRADPGHPRAEGDRRVLRDPVGPDRDGERGDARRS